MSPEQVAAQRTIENFLGQHSSQAADTVLELNASEVAQVLAAAEDRHTARTELKRILAAAYDRRQRIGAEATAAEMARRQLEVGARIVLERELKMPPDISVAVAGQLLDDELQSLAVLETTGDVADQVGAILLTARDRVGDLLEPSHDEPAVLDEAPIVAAEPAVLDEAPIVAAEPSADVSGATTLSGDK